MLRTSFWMQTAIRSRRPSSGKDGKSVTGWVQDKEGNFYYFKKGVRNSGWDKINGDWYYFYPETGVLARNTKVLNYDVDDDGRMIKVHEW